MTYQVNDYSSILGMSGISDTTLQNHFKLYQAYTNNTNTLLEKTRQLLDAGQDRTPEFAEMRRRLGFEFDGMRLHEYYFENLKGDGKPEQKRALYGQLAADFGSFDSWQKDFVSTGAMRGIGWAILYYDTPANRLINGWVTEHQQGHLVGLMPILVLDVWEHAFVFDFQMNKANYISAFLQNVNWQEAANRFDEGAEAMQRRKAA
ncbi:MAG TPA: Fe-Mn family superoxide dismutase [Armatimonadota bacterium]|jgi:Fe-Mn family superoxide dismutase